MLFIIMDVLLTNKPCKYALIKNYLFCMLNENLMSCNCFFFIFLAIYTHY